MPGSRLAAILIATSLLPLTIGDVAARSHEAADSGPTTNSYSPGDIDETLQDSPHYQMAMAESDTTITSCDDAPANLPQSRTQRLIICAKKAKSDHYGLRAKTTNKLASTPPGDVPEYCKPPPTDAVSWSRVYLCAFDEYTLFLTKVPENVVIGTAYLGIAQYVYPDIDQNKVSNHFAYTLRGVGEGAQSWRIAISISCNLGCAQTGTPVPPTIVQSGVTKTFDVHYSAADLLQGAIATINGATDFTIDNALPNSTGSVQFTLSTRKPLRCDDALWKQHRSPGCVFNTGPGTWTVNNVNAPNLAAHIYEAQKSGLPGSIASGSPLERLTDDAQITSNRTTACPGYPNYGLTCDEYPMASTYQGAAFAAANGGTGRTFPFCRIPKLPTSSGSNGWSSCLIPEHDNNSQGGQLGQVYLKQRILDHDPYFVDVPASTSHYYEYPDVAPTNVFYNDITWATNSSIVGGYLDGTFKPNNAVARQEMTAFLFRMNFPGNDAPDCLTKPFPDVPTTSIFCGYIEWAVDDGITNGYTDGNFHPTDTVSRDAMAAFLYRFAHNGAHAPACTTAPFPDVSKNSVFCGAIRWVRDSGISQGYTDGGYHPASIVARGEMSAFLHRLSSVA